MLEKLSRLREDMLEKLNNVGNLDELNDLKVKVLGKKGEFTAIMKGMAEIAAEKRAEFGKVTNELKVILQDRFDEKLNTLKEMAKQEKVIGIKCSSESTFELQQFKAVGGKDFLVFNGPDEQFVAGRAIGADAGIGGTYGVMPELFMKLNEYMNNQEINKARELQNEVNEIIKGLLSVGSLYGACKYILHLRGVETGVPRLPMLPITDEAVKEKLQKLNKTIEDLIERVK